MLPSEPIVNPIDPRQPLSRPVAAKVTTPGIVLRGVGMLAKEERFEIRGGGTTVGSAVADIVQWGLVIRNPRLPRACKQLILRAGRGLLISIPSALRQKAA